MTIGTSIACGSFTFAFHTPARTACLTAGKDRRSASGGLVIQKVEGLLVADSRPNPIERPIPCQSSSDRFRRLFRLFRQSFDLVIDFLIADLDFLDRKSTRLNSSHVAISYA